LSNALLLGVNSGRLPKETIKKTENQTKKRNNGCPKQKKQKRKEVGKTPGARRRGTKRPIGPKNKHRQNK
jgi:hypothetical protein